LARTNEDIELKPLNNNNPITSTILLSNQSLPMPPDCCPKIISKYFDRYKYIIPERIQQRWTYLRSKAHRLVEHRFFEWLIIASILASSSTLVSLKIIGFELLLFYLIGIGRYPYSTTT